MQATLLTNLLLPLALGVIMLGLGTGLTLEDFRRVVRYPKAVLVGLCLQTLVLPWVAFGLAVGFGLAPPLAIGLMLLAASPGGATANIYSHLARGDVALNITLTAINSLLCLLTMPLILDLSLQYFMDAGQYVPPPVAKVVEAAAIVLLPVAAGMLVRHFAPGFVAASARPLRMFTVLVLLLLVAVAMAQSWQVLPGWIALVGLACLLFNLASLGCGYAVPVALGLPRPQSIAVSMEIGIHNSTLALFIALNVLATPAMAIPAAVYSLVMFFTATVLAWWLNRGEPLPVPA